MRNPVGIRVTTVLGALIFLVAIVVATPHALADPGLDVSPPSDPSPAGTVDPEPLTAIRPLNPPKINPGNGSIVGVAKPIIINFAEPITDRAKAEGAIHISSNPPVPGKFYWMNDKQVRWRPFDFWPAHTIVNIDAAGQSSTFTPA